jgi:hypothetical protein
VIGLIVKNSPGLTEKIDGSCFVSATLGYHARSLLILLAEDFFLDWSADCLVTHALLICLFSIQNQSWSVYLRSKVLVHEVARNRLGDL